MSLLLYGTHSLLCVHPGRSSTQRKKAAAEEEDRHGIEAVVVGERHGLDTEAREKVVVVVVVVARDMATQRRNTTEEMQIIGYIYIYNIV